MYDRDKYLRRKSAGLATGKCVCGRPAREGSTRCVECAGYQRKAYAKRKDLRVAAGECIECGNKIEGPQGSGMYCMECKSVKKAHAKEVNRGIKLDIFRHYGNRCRCCGTDHPDFLAIDHIEGGGTKQREEVGGGTHFYLWLEKNSYPPEFQILCHNCNFSKHLNNGVCAHETEEEWIVDMGFDPLVDIKRYAGIEN